MILWEGSSKGLVPRLITHRLTESQFSAEQCRVNSDGGWIQRYQRAYLSDRVSPPAARLQLHAWESGEGSSANQRITRLHGFVFPVPCLNVQQAAKGMQMYPRVRANVWRIGNIQGPDQIDVYEVADNLDTKSIRIITNTGRNSREKSSPRIRCHRASLRHATAPLHPLKQV
jgi:hypothetical protein